jgi:hypothetical protein
MALTITSSSYAGKHAGLYVSAALKAADSLEYLTVRENVTYKEVINKVAGANLVKDATCDFTENSATLTLTEQVLEVEPFQINIDVCRKTMLSDWSYDLQDDFVAYAMTYLSDSIADSIEFNIWQGNTSTSGQFNALSRKLTDFTFLQFLLYLHSLLIIWVSTLRNLKVLKLQYVLV